jgi:hypothetical protein
MRDFAQIWRAADKIVYSTGLETVAFHADLGLITARTRIERDFDPDVVGQMKASAGRDLTVGGAALAAHAFRAGLVDECHLLTAWTCPHCCEGGAAIRILCWASRCRSG